ncbi:hypothetical protein DMB92_05270 [Campylobacter sp. MIT 99-7217]|uniref:hypothetical protein n=1 Tax=Campylobacter sp. MIT 99-7217 TaxID=535091 RepID=UPI00115BA656|nr:hypothetical protein [Campylobacter sp. MIT 99-7217]TQR31799.1 hypothetical protein DMB92_05270 [Campylobacter sp. MIT 99-7217]
MNYENANLAEISRLKDELKELLNEAKLSLEQEAINEKLAFSFESLKDELKALLQKQSKESKESLEKDFKLSVQTSTKELFEQSKEEALDEIKQGFDYANLSEEVIKNFTEQESILDNFRLVLKTRLENVPVADIVDNFKEDLNAHFEKSVNECEKIEQKLKNELENVNFNFHNMLEEKSEEVLKAFIEEHKSELFKPFSLAFLKNDLLKDEDFKAAYKKEARLVLSLHLENTKLKDEFENALLNLNGQISEDFFQSEYLKEQRFLQNIVLSSLALGNELKILQENMKWLKSFKQNEDLNTYMHNTYKVI